MLPLPGCCLSSSVAARSPADCHLPDAAWGQPLSSSGISSVKLSGPPLLSSPGPPRQCCRSGSAPRALSARAGDRRARPPCWRAPSEAEGEAGPGLALLRGVLGRLGGSLMCSAPPQPVCAPPSPCACLCPNLPACSAVSHAGHGRRPRLQARSHPEVLGI